MLIDYCNTNKIYSDNQVLCYTFLTYDHNFFSNKKQKFESQYKKVK